MAMQDDRRMSYDSALDQVEMLEQSVRRNNPAPIGRGYHSSRKIPSMAGRGGRRRYRMRPVHAGAPFAGRTHGAGDDESYYYSDEEDFAGRGGPEWVEDEGEYGDYPAAVYEDDGEFSEGEMMDDYMAAGDDLDHEDEAAMAEEAVEVPMKWTKAFFPFRKEVSLEGAAKKGSIEIPLTFNAAAKAIAHSGAKLGDVQVTDLRHNGPVSFAVRAESKPGPSGTSDIQLKAPKELLPAVGDAIHTVLDKPRGGGGGSEERKSFDVRSAGAVFDTWLARFPGWSAKNLQQNISPIKDSANVALSVDHPIAHYLHAMGHLNLDEAGDSDSTLVDAGLVNDARAEIEGQEASNPSFGDAERLRLVLVRAYGKPTPAGAPAMTDATEVVDGYIREKRTQTDVKSRLKSPIVISGKWVVSHGQPLTEEEQEEIASTGTLAELATDDTISVSGLSPDVVSA